jgi:hypothetical protein
MRRLAPAIALVAVMALASTVTANGKLFTFGTGDVSIHRGVVTLTNGAGEYSGVYVKSQNLSGKKLRFVRVSFVSSGDTAGGAPRFSIPLNTGHTESVTPYAFLDVNNCGSALVSTTNPRCKVSLNFSNETFDNWADLVATHPTWRIPKHGIPFIIADQPGTYEVSHVDLR